jgi:hypothetical protein
MSDQATIAALQAQIAKLNEEKSEMKQKASAPRELKCKVSANKGCLSVYGLNARFPVSLYANQWERLLGFSDEIRDFIVANADTLAVKE